MREEKIMDMLTARATARTERNVCRLLRITCRRSMIRGRGFRRWGEFGSIFANHQGIAPHHLDLTPVDKYLRNFCSEKSHNYSQLLRKIASIWDRTRSFPLTRIFQQLLSIEAGTSRQNSSLVSDSVK